MTVRSDIKRFWLLAHSWQSFRLALDAHQIIRSAPVYPNPDDAILKSAVTTMYIAYARPFGKNNGLPRLELVGIPEKHQALHQCLLDYRNMTIAHKDKTSHAVSALINHVVIVLAGGKCGVCPIIHFPSIDELNEFPKLVSALLDWVESQMNTSYREHIERLHLTDGRYIVDPTEEQSNWIRRDQ